MSDPSSKDPQELGGVLHRINQLGAATERVFSRLYTGLTRRSEREHEQSTRDTYRAGLEARIERAKQIEEKNNDLRQMLHKRALELNRLHGVLAKLDDGIIMQDNEGRIVFMNNAARELLGSQKNFWESELGVLFNNYQDIQSLPTELVPLGEPHRVRVNDRVLGVQMAAVAKNGGERLGTMIVLRDLTRDTLADRLKDQFVTALSHELKTPMTVIKGMSEVLMRMPDDQPPNRRLLQTLSRNVDILDRMIVELLDVSEIGAGTFDIRHTEIAMERLLWGVIKGVEPELKRKNLDVFLMTRNVEALRVTGDDQRLRWAIGHLLQNSIYYTEAGGHITIAVGVNAKDHHWVMIDFIDTGVGISEKDLPNVFDRFYRGDPRDAKGKLVDPRGLGQGLFIAKTVAEAHGGNMSVRSQVGKGSVFTLALPAMP